MQNVVFHVVILLTFFNIIILNALLSIHMPKIASNALYCINMAFSR